MFRSYIYQKPTDGMLLGAPLIPGTAMNSALEARCAELERAAGRLHLVTSHDASVIIKSSLSAPKVLHTLRSSPCTGNVYLRRFDSILRSALTNITNADLNKVNWIQASLPVTCGGLGIRSVELLAPSAFLASATATRELQALILPVGFAGRDTHVDATREAWFSQFQKAEPSAESAAKQSSWDKASVEVGLEILSRHFTDPYHRARLLATQMPHSGDWLNARPVTACGLRLDDEAIRVAVGLRLGTSLCAPHTCPCGATVDARGNHGLACRRSMCRQSRHALINDQIQRALLRATIPAVKEPAGLSRSDGKRPDGVTLIPWQNGKCLTWDVTVPDTLAASHLAHTALFGRASAEKASQLKKIKYSDLARSYDFCAIAIETLGPINIDGLHFLEELGR